MASLLKRWVTWKFYSHFEANHSIIRRYDHSLVRQYGRQINLLFKRNMLLEYCQHCTLLKSKLTRSLVTIHSACIVDRENEFALIFSFFCLFFNFSSKLSIEELFTPAFFSSFIINIWVNYVKSNSLLIHSIVSDNNYLLNISFHKPSHKGYTFLIGRSD